MKIRRGFVSNSSSSSFIVGFDHYPEDENDLKQMMFPDNKGAEKIEGTDKWVICEYDHVLTLDQIALQVFASIYTKNVKRDVDEHMILKEISSSHYIGSGNKSIENIREKSKEFENNFYKKHGKSIWDSSVSENERAPLREIFKEESKQRDKLSLEFAKKEWDEIKDQYKDKVVLIFNFEDHGPFALLEYGDVFRNIPCYRCSHH